MWFLNFMKLAEFSPLSIYQWFMEVVSIDAYDWVMKSNIASMGYYTTPSFMQKPYLSTSAYIKRMSDYKDNVPVWDGLFYNYLVKHEHELKGGAAVYLRNLATFRKFPVQKQKLMIKLAEEYISKNKA